MNPVDKNRQGKQTSQSNSPQNKSLEQEPTMIEPQDNTICNNIPLQEDTITDTDALPQDKTVCNDLGKIANARTECISPASGLGTQKTFTIASAPPQTFTIASAPPKTFTIASAPPQTFTVASAPNSSRTPNPPNSKAIQKGSIRDTVFQRLLTVFAQVPTDRLQVCLRDYIKAKSLDNKQLFHEFLLENKIVSETVCQNLLSLRDPNSISLIPGYEITGFIGEGGMAAVYKGMQSDTQQEVAVKILVPMGDASTEVARFQRECDLTKSLDHPHIVKAFASGECYGLYYFIMEYVDGSSLAERISHNGAIQEQEALEIFEHILSGMVYAWEQGLIHRDIKPANIMIGTHGPKICDFGLAKALDSGVNLTQTGLVLGTPQYMSPEQFGGNQLDYRTDVYSMGITLYVMLTGNLPFHGTSYVTLCKSHLYDEPPDPSRWNVKLSDATVSFLYRLLAKTPQERCATLLELQENFQKIKAGKSIQYTLGVKRPSTRQFIAYMVTISILLLAFVAYIYFGPLPQWMRGQSDSSAISEAQRMLDAEREKLLKEENLRREQEERRQKEIDAQRALETRKRKEEAAQKQLEEQRKKEEELERIRQAQARAQEKLEISLQSIRDSLLKLDFQYAQQETRHLEVDFPENAQMSQMKKTLQDAMELGRLLQQEDMGSASPLLKKCASVPLSLAIGQKLLLRELDQRPIAHRESIIRLWLQLESDAQQPLLPFLERQEASWLQDIFVALPKDDSSQLVALLKKSSLLPRLDYLQRLRKTVKVLKQASQDSSNSRKLKELLEDKHSQKAELLRASLRYFTLSEKESFVDAIPGIAENISEASLLLLVNTILSQSDITERKRIFSSLSQIRSTESCDAALSLMLKQESDPTLKIQILKLLAKHKKYEQLSTMPSDASATVRRAIVDIFGQQGGNRAEEILIKAVQDTEPEIRVKAIAYLGKWKVTSSVIVLIRALYDEDSEVGQRAAISLAEINNAEALQGMMSSLDTVSNQTVGQALISGIAQSDRPETWTFLIGMLLNKPQYHKETIASLKKGGKTASSQIMEYLKKTRELREQNILLSALENLGSFAVEDLCHLGTFTPDISLKRSIIKTLGNIGDPQSIPFLLNMMRDNLTKKIAAQALKSIAEKLDSRDPRYQQVKKALSEY